MSPVTAHLRMLRYYDRLIIKGKRIIVGTDYTDPCNHLGHESVLAWLSVYVEDLSLAETSYNWDATALAHLKHIMGCRHCMNRVFSVPSPEMRQAVEPLLMMATG